VSAYIEAHRASFGVEPICRTLAVAPSSYYARQIRPPSARSIRDAELKREISRIHAANFGVYGVRKLWRALRREGNAIGRDRAGRLMATLGLTGVSRARSIRTTQPGSLSQRPADLVERVFAAAAPNRLWLADITYVWTVSGFCYAAFIVDAFSRRIVGWRVAASLRAELALDALEMAIWARGDPLPGLVHRFRSGRPVPGDPVHRASRRRRRRQLGRLQGRQLRQRPGRVGQRPVQGRAHPPPAELADGGRRRAGHRRLGRVVE
jgi:putative transposase